MTKNLFFFFTLFCIWGLANVINESSRFAYTVLAAGSGFATGALARND